ncbi:MAG TPA: acetoacetate--CoA ligase [Gaiellaceae bacterium]|nr:acetoacetate--CoA ligase [Gaiellaceae bacterium]
MTTPLWTPSEAVCESSRLAAYERWLGETRGLRFESYAELWAWSVDELGAFWESIWEFFGVRASRLYDEVLPDRSMPGAKWFPGAELSYAEHVFAGKDATSTALIHSSELRPLAETTWAELREQTAAAAAGLRELGVDAGDRVVAYLPNIEEAVVAFLACASLGATWSSCSPDFGVQAVVDRFSQIDPKVLIAVDGYRYGGRDFDRSRAVEEIRQAIPSLEHSVLLPYLHAQVPHGISWQALLESGAGMELRFEQLPFDHPLWVLHSSGTTGLPKPIVHGQGGILLEHLKLLHLHFDARPGDRLFWFTTTGWMMWNLLLGGLLTEASIVLYDGSAGHPDLKVLWDLAAKAGITCFGTSAAYIASCLKAGVEPARDHDLSRLRSIGSTGSPLSPDGFRWVYEHVGPDTWLFSTSGGTDVCSAFVGGVPTLPVYEGELQARALGAKVEAFDDEGASVVDEVGELVLTAPLPSMPIGFWGDADGSRYRESYFDVYPGVWRHGDWIEITSRGTAIISGRSDSTVNRGGVRIGTSEIYRAVLRLPEVIDALVVDLPQQGTSGWVVLFVVLREEATLDAALSARIEQRLRDDCSPRHVPDEIRRVPAVPRTLSGKLVEVPVKRIMLGADPAGAASRESLANPSALDYFVELARSRTAADRPQ